MPVQRRAALLALTALALALVLFAPCHIPTASAGRGRHHLGEPWEDSIDRGVVNQRQSERRGTASKQIIERALRAVRRDDSVTKLYLLARAYGVGAQQHRLRAVKARGAATKQRATASARQAHAAALSAYGDVLRRAPRCYYAHHDMGVITLQADPGAIRAAFDQFGASYRINSRYTPTVRQLISLYFSRKQVGVALPLIQALLQEDPKDDEAAMRLVAAYTALGRHADAYRALEGMLVRNPDHSPFMALRADLDRKTGRWKRAKDTYMRIARANPNAPVPVLGLIAVVQDEAKATGTNDLDTYLFALKGFYRIERDAKSRADILKEIQRTEHARAHPEGSHTEGPPTQAQLLRGLASPDTKTRWSAVVLLLGHKEPPTPQIIRTLAGRLSANVESEPRVRVAVVMGLGLLTGSRLAPLLRMSLADPHRAVRVQTVDTLADIARRDPKLTGAVIAVLGLYGSDREMSVAAAARSALLGLTNSTLDGIDDGSDDASRRRAFAAWWAGPLGVDAQIRALDAYEQFGDRTPHTTLRQYLGSPDFFVWRAAYRALGRSATSVTDPALRRWFAARPQFGPERLQKEQWAALKGEMAVWLAAQPGR